MLVFGNADDVFTMALRIKENGRTLYTGAAKGSEDPVLAKLFEDLASLEAGHMTLIKHLQAKYYENSTDDQVWDPEGLAASLLRAAADTHVFTQEATSDRLRKAQTAPEVLDIAIQFEKDSVHFFVAMKEMIPGEKGKNKLDELIRGQLDRVRMLAEARKTCAPSRCEIIYHS